MVKKTITLANVLFFVMLFFTPGKSFGQDFVYQPVNPAFGGSPINYSWMLSSANAQNPYQGDTGFDFGRDPLENFERRIQRQILSSLVRDIIDERFGNVDLSQQSSYQFGNFSIDIFPGPSGINIVIVNTANGERTTVTIPNI